MWLHWIKHPRCARDVALQCIAHQPETGEVVDVDLDNQQYIYIAERLLREKLAQLRMRGSRFPRVNSVKPALPGVQIELGLARGAEPSIFEIARDVTRGVRKNTGELSRPLRYVRASLEMHWSAVQIISRPDLAVAWFAASLTTLEGPIFVALCGSEHNFVSYDGEPQKMPFRRYPSSPDGMLHALEAITACSAPGSVSAGARVDPDFALDSAFAFSKLRPMEEVFISEVEVLFEPFYQSEDVDLRGRCFRLGFVGAPLWVATRRHRPI